MEIRNVVNEVKNEYPKMNQITKKHLKDTIPNKWLKVGLSSLMIAMLMKNNVLATVDPSNITIEVAGGAPVEKISTPLYVYVNQISLVLFIITVLTILITIIKAKKQNQNPKVKKWIMVIFIISIILFILNFLVYIFWHNSHSFLDI